MSTNDRAALALMVIGEERRTKLINRYADGLVLRFGMRLEPATRYATGLVDEAHPVAVLAVGQTWSKPDGKKMRGEELFSFLRAMSYTVRGFGQRGPSEQEMVQVDSGTWFSFETFEGMWLTAWPDEYDLADEPQAPAVPIVDTEPEQGQESDEGESDGFDPRCVRFTAHRLDDTEVTVGEGLPLLSAPYRAVNWKKPEYEPSYGNALDVVAYLAEHLADYRAGWPDYRDQWNGQESFFGAFNELDGGCACDVRVSAYLGWWLWQRVRADVVAEYGGAVDDYRVTLMWSPGKADAVIEAALCADPEWKIPPDHPLVQCAGQTALLPHLAGEAA